MEEQWIQIGPSIQSSDEIDPLADIKPNLNEGEHESVDDNILSETEETNSHPSLYDDAIMSSDAMQLECVSITSSVFLRLPLPNFNMNFLVCFFISFLNMKLKGGSQVSHCGCRCRRR